MNKAVFLDRDGTINIDTGYVYKYEDFKFIDGVEAALKLLKDYGYLLVIVTNQSGIARGFYSEEEFLELHRKINLELSKKGIYIDGLYYCPHLTGCVCRKPQTTLFMRAAEELNIDLKNSFAIGDRMRDLQICTEQPVKGYLITNEMQKTEEIPEGADVKIVSSLYEAAKEICEEK